MQVLPVLIAIAALCGCVEQSHRRYASRADAVAAGELARGWLPDWVPEAAFDIRLQGDLDTNRIWLRFELPPSDFASLRSKLRRLSADEVSSLPVSRPGRSSRWWFDGLVSQDSGQQRTRPAELFEGFSEDFILAFEEERGRIFAWSTP